MDEAVGFWKTKENGTRTFLLLQDKTLVGWILSSIKFSLICITFEDMIVLYHRTVSTWFGKVMLLLFCSDYVSSHDFEGKSKLSFFHPTPNSQVRWLPKSKGSLVLGQGFGMLVIESTASLRSSKFFFKSLSILDLLLLEYKLSSTIRDWQNQAPIEDPCSSEIPTSEVVLQSSQTSVSCHTLLS